MARGVAGLKTKSLEGMENTFSHPSGTPAAAAAAVGKGMMWIRMGGLVLNELARLTEERMMAALAGVVRTVTSAPRSEKLRQFDHGNHGRATRREEQHAKGMDWRSHGLHFLQSDLFGSFK
ncbi:hypothetical protein HPP92_008305 [Vanilla planifolia]|uniref:Uncharacterized protein n=1 Tax=Vanilla planifolia TaxID=51239 RepID=A0A835V5W2_VANPL|nr:hypothetical protein HPP92_008305 [Vanilla planifolia]